MTGPPKGPSSRLLLPETEAAPSVLIRPSQAGDPQVEGERASRAAAAGHLIRLARDVYLDRDLWDAAPAWEKYELAIAAKAHSHPHARFRRETALRLCGLPLLGTPRDVTLRADTRASAGRVPAAAVGGLAGFDLCRASAGAPAPTIVPPPNVLRAARGPAQGYRVEELIPVLTDTVPRMSRAAGVVVLDAVLAGPRRPGSRGSLVQQAGGVPRDVLADHAQQMTVKRHRRRFLDALDAADQRSESAGESLMRVLMKDLGFGVPALQVPITVRGRTYWADAEFEEAGVVVEFDGLQKYDRGGGPLNRAEAAQAVVAEKRREDDIRSTGRRMVRFVWDDLNSLATIEAALLRACVPQK